MTESLDTRQSLAEIERVHFKRFPFTSASIAHVTNSSGAATIRIGECNVMVGVDESILADGQRGRA